MDNGDEDIDLKVEQLTMKLSARNTIIISTSLTELITSTMTLTKKETVLNLFLSWKQT